MVEHITSFRGRYRFLSNFSPSDISYGEVWWIPVDYQNFLWNNIELPYQAAKCKHYSDINTFCYLSPVLGKKLGRIVEIRDDWEDIKFEVMEHLVRQKFTRHEHLKNQLLETGDAVLIEGNNWGDRIWGQCPVGVGENYLGRILMKVREELCNGTIS